jgi:hypothetical protein
LQAAANVDFDAAVSSLAAHQGSLSDEDLLGLAGGVSEKLNHDATGFLTQHAAAGSLSFLFPAITNALVKESSGQERVVWDWLKGQPEDSFTKALTRHLLNTCGEQDIAMAFQLAENVPQISEGTVQLSLLADGLLGHGALLPRLDKLLQQAPQRLHQPLIESAFRYLNAERLGDPQRWVVLFSQLEDDAYARAVESLSRAWAEQSPEEAIAWANSMPAGATRVEAVEKIAAAWAAKDSPSASIWIAAMPAGRERDHCAQALVAAIAEEFPREAWDWAMSINDVDERIRAATYAAKRMAARDLLVARAWVESAPFTTEAKAAMQSVLEATTPQNSTTP